MNISEIWGFLKNSGVGGALQVVAQYPECDEKLKYLIQHCIIVHNVIYAVDQNAEDHFEQDIDWLCGLASQHDIDKEFRQWLEYLDIGLQRPFSQSQRQAIYNDLLTHSEPVFVFDVREMNEERRALVDLGLAIALPDDGAQFEQGGAHETITT